MRKVRAANADHYREYDRKRFQEDPRVRDRHVAYQVSDAGKAAMRRASAKWLKANPEKRVAQVALNNAIRDGRVVKPSACQKCGQVRKLQAHHHDYTTPLEVDWLCIPCHRTHHPRTSPGSTTLP